MNFYEQESSQQKIKNGQCHLCENQDFSVMLNRALYDRYLTNVNHYYTNPIQDLINEQITPETCLFRQILCDNSDQQLLKRQYRQQEYDGKIQMLSQFYKFHRDVPRIFETQIFRILGKYFDRLRHFDYKKIKCVLKEQQGISLTTQKSDQSSVNSSIQIKSRYSSVLGQLDNNSQSESQILQNFCKKSDKIIEKVDYKKQIKGHYFSGQKKFEEYLLNTKKANNKSQKLVLTNNKFEEKKNYNLYQNQLYKYQNLNGLTQRTDNPDQFRKKSIKKKNQQIQLKTNVLKQSLKNFKKIKNKNFKSIQKTTANETISRQQKSKKYQKLQKTLQLQIQKNSYQIFKPFSTGLIALKSNSIVKTLDQIYKPISVHQKYHSDKSKKSIQGIKNLNKIYQEKLSQRKINSKIQSKNQSAHEIKDTKNQRQYILIDGINVKVNTQKITIDKQKDEKLNRYSSKKHFQRSKSASTNIKSNVKSSQKNLMTIDTVLRSQSRKSNTKISQQKLKPNRVNQFMQTKFNVKGQIQTRQLKQRTSSKKKLEGPKDRSSSMGKLHHTQKIQKSSSKSNVTSARNSQAIIDKKKFCTIDADSNDIMDKFLQRKLTLVQKPKQTAKFYD